MPAAVIFCVSKTDGYFKQLSCLKRPKYFAHIPHTTGGYISHNIELETDLNCFKKFERKKGQKSMKLFTCERFAAAAAKCGTTQHRS